MRGREHVILWHLQIGEPASRLMISFPSRTFIYAISVPVIAVAAWCAWPLISDLPAICLWKNIFGVDCPGCGMTRAACALTHGEFRLAFALNPLIVPITACAGMVYARHMITILGSGANVAGRDHSFQDHKNGGSNG
jgi:hypothetical protein